jgi:Tfp pilus assembly protein PilN
MLLLNRFERRTNWDYRDYCDYRSRQKRRLRLRLSIALMLLVCLLLATGIGTLIARARVQPLQQIDASPLQSTPTRLQEPDDAAAHHEIRQVESYPS